MGGKSTTLTNDDDGVNRDTVVTNADGEEKTYSRSVDRNQRDFVSAAPFARIGRRELAVNDGVKIASTVQRRGDFFTSRGANSGSRTRVALELSSGEPRNSR